MNSSSNATAGPLNNSLSSIRKESKQIIAESLKPNTSE